MVGRRATINDIARLANVSKKTVSRVINQSSFVKEETRAKIDAVIQQIGYAPDPQARGLAFRRSFLLGLPALFGTVSWPVDVVAKATGWVARFPVASLREFAASRPVVRDAVAELLIASSTGRAIVA